MRLLFNHIRKTGGVSIISCMKQATSVEWHDRFHRLKGEANAFAGHWHPDTFFEKFGKRDDDVVFTVLRDPAERWLSYFFWKLGYKNTRKNLADPCTKAARSGPETFLKRVVRDNYLVDNVFPLEKQAHIGDFANLDATRQWLENFFGIPLSLPHENVNPDKGDPCVDPEWFLESVRQKCPRDYEFYEEARRQSVYLSPRWS